MGVLLVACIVAPLTVATVQGGSPGLKLTPAVIEMGAFYGGATVKVEGILPAGSQALIVVRGPQTEEVFNKKGRLGPIWVNVGKVHISGVPSLFLCFSSTPVASLLTRESMDANQLDQVAIKAQMIVEPAAMDQEVIRDNYLSLKNQQGFFKVTEGAVNLGVAGPEGVPFTLDLPWSKKAPPASYEVSAYECRDGAVVGKIASGLEVREMGFPEKIAGMARNRGYLYGMLCVLVAMIAGFGIDFVAMKLGKKGAVAH
jgi:uncharacterized protein (TIGR02186 family)